MNPYDYRFKSPIAEHDAVSHLYRNILVCEWGLGLGWYCQVGSELFFNSSKNGLHGDIDGLIDGKRTLKN